MIIRWCAGYPKEQAGGVVVVQRVVIYVDVGLACEAGNWVSAEELCGAGVILSCAEVDKAGVGVGVLSVVAEWCGGGACAGGGFAVGAVGEGGFLGAGGVGYESR